MPPKPKYTKEEIIEAAFELARKDGIDSVVARSVGKQLNTSATPIFTCFSSMDELKAEVMERGKALFFSRMSDVLDYSPAFKEFGLRWVSFAKEEPNVYKMLFWGQKKMLRNNLLIFENFQDIFIPMIKEVSSTFQISTDDARNILNQMLIHGNGIASFCMDEITAFSEEQISSSLSQVCIGLVLSTKLRDGSFNETQGQRMSESALSGVKPEKIR